ncbi:hypothetical protein OS121_28725 [Mycolicibacterium mucogenicum]|uniref:hypothetical protein n=1 Tax=Mycolicibacterium mucogenicum TaxID=56689 RepID=UPI002269BDDD|nr:hypothetical protein [Mycolicibacterium mucogenicum]MCX8559030.1 hypothetical protein [Mycolicibacterium mucogenicum]
MSTPRRTVRIPDAEWDAGHAKAQSQGETLTDVLRRLLADYLVGNADELGDYGTEYRATPKDADSALTVEYITGRFEDVRRLYPPKNWHLEERTVSPYKASSRRAV